MKLVYESLEDILKPKGINEVIKLIKPLSVKEKISKIKEMQVKWGEMYKDLLHNDEVLEDIKNSVKKELDQLKILDKINYIETLEKSLPEIFNNLKDEKTINDLKKYINSQDFENKAALIWRFFKTWPNLFKYLEDDIRIEPESNQLILLFKIKGAIDKNEIDKLQSFIYELGEKYGRKNILEKAKNIKIINYRGYEENLFNRKDIEQLKISLYKETRNEEELLKDEIYDIYAFIGYEDYKDTEINGESYSKKILGIENLVKINRYDMNSLSQVSMMKIRANAQYGGTGTQGGVYGVYIPKDIWNKNHAHNEEIPNNLRQFIDANKFKL